MCNRPKTGHHLGLPATGGIADKSASLKQVQPRVTLSYTPNSSTNIYANWGIGFKSGGFINTGSSALVNANFNIPAIGAGVTINDQFRKERSRSFEAGIKGSLFDNRVTFDLAGYYTRITDMQFFEFFVGSFGLLRVQLNTSAKIVDRWKVFGSVNLTDSEIKANASRPYTVGNKSPYTADYTINLGSQIDAPLNDRMDHVVRADYRITGAKWFHTVQDQTGSTIFSQLLPISALALPGFVGNANYSVAKRDPFGVLNLRVGLEGDN